MKKVFIDGSSGTTGLRISERLSRRSDIELITLDVSLRHDTEARRSALNSADIVFLCLPDDAAIEAVSMVTNPDTVIIDSSTAHRTDPDFAYGFPELGEEFLHRIETSKRITVPGCHATGFISLVYPLVKNGLLDRTAHLNCHSLTGYSGGGKQMIAAYQSHQRDELLCAPRQYGLSQCHKHLKEMTCLCGLDIPPIFSPIVCDYYSGMETTVSLFADMIHGSVADICDIYSSFYNGPIVNFAEQTGEGGFLSAAKFAGSDRMQISVQGNEERILAVARFDNLGKGASGAAIECMNIVLGCDKTEGLSL